MPLSFPAQSLRVEQNPLDWHQWTLLEPLSYYGIRVDAGFTTDGASIPRFLWAIVPTWARYSKAAVIHDYLYSRLREGRPDPLAPTRRAADNRFFEMMVDLGVNVYVRWTMWLMVRIFGRFAT